MMPMLYFFMRLNWICSYREGECHNLRRGMSNKSEGKRKAPNSKSQAPEKHQTSNSNIKEMPLLMEPGWGRGGPQATRYPSRKSGGIRGAEQHKVRTPQCLHSKRFATSQADNYAVVGGQLVLFHPSIEG